MKKKLTFTFFVLIALLTFLALSTSAFEFRDYECAEPSGIARLSNADELLTLIDVFEMQKDTGYISDSKNLLCVVTDGVNVRLICTGKTMGNVASVAGPFWSITGEELFIYEWSTDVGWVYHSKATSLHLQYGCMFYSALLTSASYGTPFSGVFPSAIWGEEALCNADEVLAYYSVIYDSVVNRFENERIKFEEGYTAGHAIGHGRGEEAGYDKGYDKGYEVGFEQGNWIGLYDCSLTHEQLLAEQREFDKSYYTTVGMGLCEDTHYLIEQEFYDLGWNEAFAWCLNNNHQDIWNEGYNFGLREVNADVSSLIDNAYNNGYNAGNKSAQAKYDEGFKLGQSLGYDEGFGKGYTESINTSNTVVKFIDALFTAPINFFHGMFDGVEVFGFNLFNVAMVALSLSVAVVVLAVIVKFRR